MRHRIIVLGAGYAGAYAAGQLARRLHPDDVEITVVTAEPDFVERPRLHQLAAGQELRRHPWGELFAGTGIRVRQARVTAVADKINKGIFRSPDQKSGLFFIFGP